MTQGKGGMLQGAEDDTSDSSQVADPVFKESVEKRKYKADMKAACRCKDVKRRLDNFLHEQELVKIHNDEIDYEI